MLVRHGYGVLLLDARGYDGSEGDPNLFGWAGARDIDAGLGWLQSRPDLAGGRIGGIGFSVGGEVMLEAAASTPELLAVVSDGAGVPPRSARTLSAALAAGSRSPNPQCRQWRSRS